MIAVNAVTAELKGTMQMLDPESRLGCNSAPRGVQRMSHLLLKSLRVVAPVVMQRSSVGQYCRWV